MIMGVTYKAVAIRYAKKSHSKNNTNNKFYLLRRRSITTKELQQNARKTKIVKKRIFFSSQIKFKYLQSDGRNI